MRTLRRIAALVVLSVSGIALLGPLAARSAVELAAPVADGLLDATPGSDAGAAPARGLLATREMTDAAASAGAAELIGEAEIPAPGPITFAATIVAIPTPAPVPVPAPAAPAPAVGGGSVWDALAECESGGNWSINTGNGYYGGLQFSYATWHDFGGGEFAEYPHQATREEQIVVAERLHAARGFQPWPACRAELGLP